MYDDFTPPFAFFIIFVLTAVIAAFFIGFISGLTDSQIEEIVEESTYSHEGIIRSIEFRTGNGGRWATITFEDNRVMDLWANQTNFVFSPGRRHTITYSPYSDVTIQSVEIHDDPIVGVDLSGEDLR